MVVQVLNSLLFCTAIFLSLGSSQKRLIQRAFVIEHNAIIYDEPDFDATQVARIDRHKILAISTRIYRPKNLFGSFYKVFINKPKKIRGYISEIDVIPQYKYKKKGYVLNDEYTKKESFLKAVKEQSHIQKKKSEAVTKEKSQVSQGDSTDSKEDIKPVLLEEKDEGESFEENKIEEGDSGKDKTEESGAGKDETKVNQNDNG